MKAECIAFVIIKRSVKSERIGNKYMERNTNGETVEMPVQMAIMMAQNKQAVTAFGKLEEKRRREYIMRAKSATSINELRSVVEDIVKIG